MEFKQILIVCIGNICRSPTAERLLAKYTPNKTVSSAGIHALEGHCADEQAYRVAQNHQLSLDNHIARQLTAELCMQNDLILVMEKKHIEEVCRISPESRSKVMLLGHWQKNKEIVDPFRKSDDFFEHIYTMLDEATRLWAEKLNLSN